jgi:hypothetical protein
MSSLCLKVPEGGGGGGSGRNGGQFFCPVCGNPFSTMQSAAAHAQMTGHTFKPDQPHPK